MILRRALAIAALLSVGEAGALLAQTATEIVPGAAPTGARVIVVGTGLDRADIQVSFSTRTGGTSTAAVVVRSPLLVEAIVPPDAASGPVRIANGAAAVAVLPFTVVATAPYTEVATLVMSRPSHDVLKAPTGTVVDRVTGDVYVADQMHHQVRRIRPSGQIELVVGSGRPGLRDGTPESAELKEPRSVAFDAVRNVLYVADTGNHVIRRVLSGGTVETFVGSGRPGDGDGARGAAQFKEPSGLALDTEGNLYVADTGNHRIRKVTPAGVVATVAGAGRPGYADGVVAGAAFHAPQGVAVGLRGVLYVADTGNHALRAIANNRVETIAGARRAGRSDGIGTVAEFREPTALAVDDSNTIFVADTGNNLVRRVSILEGVASVVTVAGTGKAEHRDGVPVEAEFNRPTGLSVAGALFIGDEKNDAVRMLAPHVSVNDFYARTGKPQGGEPIRIFGEGFVPGRTQVFFGGVPATVVTYVASTEIIATTPPHAAGDVELRVTAPGGVALAARAFRYVQPFVALTITPASATVDIGKTAQFTAWGTAADGSTVDLTTRVAWAVTNAAIASVDSLGAARGVAAGTTTVSAAFEGLADTAGLAVRQPEALPPDPATVASALDPTVASDMSKSVQFLYTGATPIQRNVAAGAIDTQRVTVVRGRVLDASASPLGGVRVSVLGKSQFGFTLTRADGMYDMAVNGGGPVTLAYEKNGWIAAQRRTETRWRDYVVVDDVHMIGFDGASTVVQMGAGTPQIARGSAVADADGERRATVLILSGTSATLQTAAGAQPASALTIRATEFTVGPNGPKLMPAVLPPTSAYTYCVELSADEAVAANASSVNFTKPLALYVENFLGFPVGTRVPVGSYDRTKGAWIPSDNGVVLKITDESNGVGVDVTGDDVADDATSLGVTAEELQQLATLYEPGQTLWRASITHFTPWDLNWPYMPPPGATAPHQPQPTWFPGVEDPETQCGSTIDCHNQVFGETIPIDGTAFSLRYQSDHAPGYRASYSVEIPISGAEVPEPLKRIEVEVQIQGRVIKRSFPASPNQTHRFTWDGFDAYGRDLQGMQPARIRVGYVYDGVYADPASVQRSFATVSGVPISTNRGTRAEFTLWQHAESLVGGIDDRPLGFGGWTFDAVKTLEPSTGILHAGAGRQRSGDLQRSIIDLYAGGGTAFGTGDGGFARDATLKLAWAIAAAPDGGVYISDWTAQTIRFVSRQGIISTAITNAGAVNAMAVGPDEALYYVVSNQVWRWDRVTRVRTLFAGASDGSVDLDEIPATQAGLGSVEALAFGPDGSLYTAGQRIRRIGPDGIIYPVTGRTTLPLHLNPEGRSAMSTNVGAVAGVAVGDDGTVYFTVDRTAGRVFSISPSGTIRRFAGTGIIDFDNYKGDGGQAVDANLNFPATLAVSRDGSVYIGDLNYATIRRVAPNGIITTAAGVVFGFDASGDGGLAPAATLSSTSRLATGPDGAIYVTDQLYMTARRISPPVPLSLTGEYHVPNPDGRSVEVFNPEGRHLRTVDAVTGLTLWQYAYGVGNRLLSITDKYGNRTQIERDASGVATAIVGPFGHRTTLTVGGDGYLEAVENGAGERIEMAYVAGQMTSMKNARDFIKSVAYDTDGRLLREELPGGGGLTLTRTGTDRDAKVVVQSGEGLTVIHERQLDQMSRDSRMDVEAATGLTVTNTLTSDGRRAVTMPGGMSVSESSAADPRFKAMAPLWTRTIRTPAGRVLTSTTERSVILSNKNDPLSLRSITETYRLNGQPWQWTFNKAFNTVTTLSPAGRRSTATLNAKGDVAQVQFPAMATTSLTYDGVGRVSSVRSGNRTWTVTYTARGDVEHVTDPLLRTTSFEYDDAGRVTKQTLPDTRIIAFTYDKNGNLTSITPPGRAPHEFGYTAVDLVGQYAAPATHGGAATYEYDRDGKIKNITRADGTTITPTYDAAGRISALTTPQGTYTYAYSANTGQVVSMSEPAGSTVTYSYDGPLLTGAAWSGPVSGAVTLSYDNTFRVGTENGVPYQYDVDGILTRAGDLTLTRDAANGLLTATALGSVSDSYIYNEFGEVVRYQATVGGTTLMDVEYERDAAGRIASRSDHNGSGTSIEKYDYDRAGRLIRVTRDDVAVSEYDYDANSNRTARRFEGGTETGSVDAEDRLLTYGDTTFAYSDNGELVSRTINGETTTFGYDVLGNLRTVQMPGKSVEYVVDAQNRRIGKKVDGTLVQGWLYGDELRIVAELDGTGATVSRFVYGSRVNTPDYMIKAGVTYRIVTDHVGSPVFVVNVSDGSIAQQMQFDVFGRVLHDSNPGFQPFGFAGGLLDRDTGLVRFGARDYDAVTGRWTAKDPIGFAAGDPNLYGYAIADPVNNIDPDGLAPRGSQSGVLPGTNIRYRIDWNQEPFPNMHVYWPNGKETVISHKGGWNKTHGGKDKVTPPKRYRDALRKVTQPFVKKAAKMSKAANKLSCFLAPALGLFEDIDTWLRAEENGRSADEQLREDLKDAGPMLDTPIGLIPNPYHNPLLNPPNT